MNTYYAKNNVQLLVPAGLVPDGSTILKVTGVVEYILMHEVKIHGLKGTPTIINCTDDVRFMVRKDGQSKGTISAISSTDIVRISLPAEDADSFIENNL